MTNLWLPDTRLELPELFEPGKKPGGDWVVDKTHPIAKKLGFYICPGINGHCNELIRGYPISTKDVVIGSGGNGCILADPVDTRVLSHTVGNDFASPLSSMTLFIHVKILSDDNNLDNYLMTYYRWGFGCWRMLRTGNEAANREVEFGIFLYNGSGYSYHSAAETTTKITTDFLPHVIVGRWTGTGGNVDLFIDGKLIVSNSVGTDGPMEDRTNPLSCIAGDREGAHNGDNETYSYGVFPTALSDLEIAEFSKRPYDFLRRV